MSELALVGIDLGKHSFHLHGQDKPGRELFRKKLSRQQMMRFFSNLPACTVDCKSGGDHRFLWREIYSYASCCVLAQCLDENPSVIKRRFGRL